MMSPALTKPLPLSVSSAEHFAVVDAVRRALAARLESGKAGIAASVLCDGHAVATGENEVHLNCDPTKHAEMVAITRAADALGSTDLKNCVMISTLQPCEMCLAAMRFAGIRRVIFAATKARVAAKYFVFPHLNIDDFIRCDDFEAIGGVCEDLVLHLYATGDE